MFNPQKIKDLLAEAGIKNNELLKYMGKNWNGSLDYVLKGDIRVSKIEMIADFFGVPIDTFFDRASSNNGVVVGGVSNCVHHFSVNPDKAAREKLEVLLAEKDILIAEKEKRIKALEEIIDLLKAQLATK